MKNAAASITRMTVRVLGSWRRTTSAIWCGSYRSSRNLHIVKSETMWLRQKRTGHILPADAADRRTMIEPVDGPNDSLSGLRSRGCGGLRPVAPRQASAQDRRRRGGARRLRLASADGGGLRLHACRWDD